MPRRLDVLVDERAKERVLHAVGHAADDIAADDFRFLAPVFGERRDGQRVVWPAQDVAIPFIKPFRGGSANSGRRKMFTTSILSGTSGRDEYDLSPNASRIVGFTGIIL